MAKNKNITVSFRVWFFSDGEKLLGKGRVELLERIKQTGSIMNAAMKMKMSYRQAWQMVEEMNECSKKPLVEKQLGGKSGGGTKVTAAGENLIELFNDFEAKVGTYVKEESKKLNL